MRHVVRVLSRSMHSGVFRLPENRAAIALSSPAPAVLQHYRDVMPQSAAWSGAVEKVKENTQTGFNYNPSLLLGLLGQLSQQTVVPVEESPRKKDISVFYGAGVGLGGLVQLIFTLAQCINAQEYNLKVVSKEHLLHSPAWEKQTKLLVFPGGSAMSMLSAFNKVETPILKRRVVDYVLGGGQYYGACAGGIMGTQRLFIQDSSSRRWTCPGTTIFDFYPGAAVHPNNQFKLKLVEIDYEFRAERRHKKARLKRVSEEFAAVYHTGIRFVRFGALLREPGAQRFKEELSTLKKNDPLAGSRGAVRILSHYLSPAAAPAIVNAALGDGGSATLAGLHIEYQPNAPHIHPTDSDDEETLRNKQAICALLQGYQQRNLGLFGHILSQRHGVLVSPNC